MPAIACTSSWGLSGVPLEANRKIICGILPVKQQCQLYDDVENSNARSGKTDLRPRQPEQAQECAWRCHSGLRRPHVSGSAQALAHTAPAARLPQHPPPDTSSTINNAHPHSHVVKSMFDAAQHDTHFGCSKHAELSHMVLLSVVQSCSY